LIAGDLAAGLTQKNLDTAMDSVSTKLEELNTAFKNV